MYVYVSGPVLATCYRNHTTFPVLASLKKFSNIITLAPDRKKIFLWHFKILSYSDCGKKNNDLRTFVSKVLYVKFCVDTKPAGLFKYFPKRHKKVKPDHVNSRTPLHKIKQVVWFGWTTCTYGWPTDQNLRKQLHWRLELLLLVSKTPGHNLVSARK